MQINNFVFSIDPGLEGAWAILTRGGEFVDTGEIPRFDKLLNGVELSTLIRQAQVKQIVIERVHSMPKQGVASSFSFGAAFGLCIGVAAGQGLPVSFITPQLWKKHFRLIGAAKGASVERAIQLYPAAAGHLRLKKHHGRADAILLGRCFLDLATQGTFI